MASKSRESRKNIVRGIIGFLIFLLLVPTVLFAAAGTLRWLMGWLYAALLLTSSAVSRLIVLKKNPDLLYERAGFTRSEGTKTWDRMLVIVGLYGAIATVIVAGLDHRFGWLPVIRSYLQYIAVVVIAGGYALGVWAMVVNRYFSSVARIQKNREHVVVASGPYGFVRHPGYAGALIAYIALPIMLDALWAFIPAIVNIAVLVVRTALEDRMLSSELCGYSVYAEKTRFRLIPGVW